jgi:hypothetical protein
VRSGVYPKPVTGPGECPDHPDSDVTVRNGKPRCIECIREFDRTCNQRRDARPVCLLAEAWK